MYNGNVSRFQSFWLDLCIAWIILSFLMIRLEMPLWLLEEKSLLVFCSLVHDIIKMRQIDWFPIEQCQSPDTYVCRLQPGHLWFGDAVMRSLWSGITCSSWVGLQPVSRLLLNAPSCMDLVAWGCPIFYHLPGECQLMSRTMCCRPPSVAVIIPRSQCNMDQKLSVHSIDCCHPWVGLH